MSIAREVRRQQRAGARFRGIAFDRNGYVEDFVQNLYIPLSASFRAALEAAGAGETKPQRHRPSKLHSLHSSAVLAIDGSERFQQLDALQLLKHALGLARSAPGPFSLLYLYYDTGDGSAIADRHRTEIDRFAARVDAALGFSALSYQALCARLAQAPAIDRDYLDYLGGRNALIEAARSR